MKHISSVILAALIIASAAMAQESSEAVDFPLHQALREGAYDAAIHFLVRTRDLNAADHNGDTPLTIAANDESADAYDMVRALLEHGADVNQSDGHSILPLFYAVTAGNLAVVVLMVDDYAAKLYSNDDDSRIFDPLFGAYQFNHKRVAKFLESRGATLPSEAFLQAKKLGEFHDFLSSGPELMALKTANDAEDLTPEERERFIDDFVYRELRDKFAFSSEQIQWMRAWERNFGRLVGEIPDDYSSQSKWLADALQRAHQATIAEEGAFIK